MVDFSDRLIFLDTSPFIYYLEGSSNFKTQLSILFDGNNRGDFEMVTSVLTLTEVLVVPFRNDDKLLIEEYQELLSTSTHLKLQSIDAQIAQLAAKLRSNYKLKTPDAIQLATAIDQECDLFLTHDLRLQKITEIEVLTLDQL